jgi:hypothetical protein
MSRHKGLDARIVAAGATVLAAAVLVPSPQPSHADDPTTSLGFPKRPCPAG